MKPVIAAVLFACILLSACATMRTDIQPSNPSYFPSPSPSKSPAALPSPTAAPPSPIPEPSDYYTEVLPFSGFTMEPNDSTIIIADSGGTVLFGYSDGLWLTHSQAAAYCGGDMTFYSISPNGKKASVSSKTAELGEDEARSCVNNEKVIIEDVNNDIILKLQGKAKGFLCRIDPARIPDFKAVKDYSSISSLLQPLLDEQFGKGCVKVKITSAVQADIDGDGEKETLVNASNLEGYDRYESYDPEEGSWYSVVCAIEPDGSFAFIQESYDTGLKEESWFFAIRGVVDVNGDGICEILTENEGWEYWGMWLSFVEDNELVPPMIYDWTS